MNEHHIVTTGNTGGQRRPDMSTNNNAEHSQHEKGTGQMEKASYHTANQYVKERLIGDFGSLNKAASRIGVPRTTLHDSLNREALPPSHIRDAIAKYLGEDEKILWDYASHRTRAVPEGFGVLANKFNRRLELLWMLKEADSNVVMHFDGTATKVCRMVASIMPTVRERLDKGIDIAIVAGMPNGNRGERKASADLDRLIEQYKNLRRQHPFASSGGTFEFSQIPNNHIAHELLIVIDGSYYVVTGADWLLTGLRAIREKPGKRR